MTQITSYELCEELKIPEHKRPLFFVAWDSMRNENGRRAFLTLLGYAMPLKRKQTPEERRQKQAQSNQVRRDSLKFSILYKFDPTAPTPPHIKLPEPRDVKGMKRAAWELGIKESYLEYRMVRSPEKIIEKRIPHPNHLSVKIVAVCILVMR